MCVQWGLRRRWARGRVQLVLFWPGLHVRALRRFPHHRGTNLPCSLLQSGRIRLLCKHRDCGCRTKEQLEAYQKEIGQAFYTGGELDPSLVSFA